MVKNHRLFQLVNRVFSHVFFPGTWTMKPAELNKTPFQRDDRVQWTRADEDIPEGHIGRVVGVRQTGDKESAARP